MPSSDDSALESSSSSFSSPASGFFSFSLENRKLDDITPGIIDVVLVREFGACAWNSCDNSMAKIGEGASCSSHTDKSMTKIGEGAM